MANRSTLYAMEESADGAQPKRMWGLSEWPWDIPVSHLILVGAEPQMCHSYVWNFDGKIAVRGDFVRGRQQFFTFLELLRQRAILPAAELDEAIADARAVLDVPSGDRLVMLLEAGEILEMMDVSDQDSLEKLNENEVFGQTLSEKDFPGLLDSLEKQAAADGVAAVWGRLGITDWSDLTWLGLEQAYPPSPAADA